MGGAGVDRASRRRPGARPAAVQASQPGRFRTGTRGATTEREVGSSAERERRGILG
jgi:hypothetical protein